MERMNVDGEGESIGLEYAGKPKKRGRLKTTWKRSMVKEASEAGKAWVEVMALAENREYDGEICEHSLLPRGVGLT